MSAKKPVLGARVPKPIVHIMQMIIEIDKAIVPFSRSFKSMVLTTASSFFQRQCKLFPYCSSVRQYPLLPSLSLPLFKISFSILAFLLILIPKIIIIADLQHPNPPPKPSRKAIPDNSAPPLTTPAPCVARSASAPVSATVPWQRC